MAVATGAWRRRIAAIVPTNKAIAPVNKPVVPGSGTGMEAVVPVMVILPKRQLPELLLYTVWMVLLDEAAE